jgi:hypothetical protein
MVWQPCPALRSRWATNSRRAPKRRGSSLRPRRNLRWSRSHPAPALRQRAVLEVCRFLLFRSCLAHGLLRFRARQPCRTPARQYQEFLPLPLFLLEWPQNFHDGFRRVVRPGPSARPDEHLMQSGANPSCSCRSRTSRAAVEPHQRHHPPTHPPFVRLPRVVPTRARLALVQRPPSARC